MLALFKKSIRDLIGLGWRAIAISLITAIGVAVFAGGFMSRESISNTRDSYYRELKLADLDVYFEAVEESEMPKLNLPSVKYEKRFFYETSIDMSGKEPVSLVIIHQQNRVHFPVNDVKILKGNRLAPNDKEGILLDRTFAEFHGYQVGDKIGIRSLGKPVEFTIRGIVITPEFLVPMGSPYLLIPLKGSLGVAFANMDRIEEMFGYALYNNLSFIFSDNRTFDKDAVLEALTGLKIDSIKSRKDQFSYKWLEQDLRAFSVFVPAVVFLFGMVVCVVTIMVFNRLIQSQRREIGILMALGYRRRHIFLSYLTTSFSLGMLGGIIGMALSPLLCWMISESIAYSLDLPDVRYIFPLMFAWEGLLIGIMLCLASSTLPLSAIFRLIPQDAIRHSESRKVLRKILDITKTVDIPSLALRYSVRNLVRRPGVSFATIALVALAISICTAFYSSTESWSYYADTAIAAEKWDIVCLFRAPLTNEEANEIWNKSELTNIRPFSAEAGVIKIKGVKKDFAIYGDLDIRDNTTAPFIEGGYFSSNSAFEVIFSKVDNLPIKVGEQVTLSTQGKDYQFRVAGIINRITTGIAYIPGETAKTVISNKVRGFYANTSLPPEKIKKLLYLEEDVAWVQPRGDIRIAVTDLLANATAVTRVSLWISIGMAILFLLTGVTINIRDREGEYATLASIGFSDRFLTGVILSETVIEGFIALVVSVPLAYLFAYYLNYEIGKAWFKMDLYFGAKELIEVMIYAFLFLPVSALPGIRHISTMNIPVTVRRKSFG